MLVLKRKPGEEIVIAGICRVTVVECGRNGVRLGFTAPADVAVDRAEIHDRKYPPAAAPLFEALKTTIAATSQN